MPRPTPRLFAIGFVTTIAVVAAAMNLARAGCGNCTGGCRTCVPTCSGSWDEKRTTKPRYTMTCEYACVRGRDPWHAPAPECRCHPPCGDVIVKKRFYKTDGTETVERVPAYEVKMVPVAPCGRASDHDGPRPCWWNPLALLHRCTSWW